MTPAFLGPLRVEKIGSQRWLLFDDLQFRSANLNAVIAAPRGFQTDFASIPRPLWAVYPPVDDYDPAAVMHDAAYAGALVTTVGERVHLIKPLADRLFLEALGVVGVNPVRRRLMYWMVSAFGDMNGHPLALHRV